ncbi:MAG: methylenetetrahydrofolate reductase [NAD(P)H] [Alphaproteobacteria bacterium]|nr:methylenetetrahydrofolate reductase [NAD(P)H] [Alphaproteobacteria bacterium]
MVPAEHDNASLVHFSFEFFPPKTDEAEDRFWGTLHRLAPLRPKFVSVTYGAGGSTRERTLRLVSKITNETGITTAAHLTCVGATRAEIDEVVRLYAEAGISRIVALRGDPPEGIGAPFMPHPNGYQSGADLVAGIMAQGAFDVSVAAYPEKHPQSPDWGAEIDNLKRKIDAGARRAITQMFFENADFYRLRDLAAAAGVSAPIIPGIQPIHSFKQVSSFAARCGAGIPDRLKQRFADAEPGSDQHAEIATEVLEAQVEDLRAHGVGDFHVFTLNRANLILPLAERLTHLDTVGA